MKILMHACCGPCTTYPLEVLRDKGYEPTAYFFNPNIHPFREFKKRLASLRLLAEKTGLAVEYDSNYGLREYLREVVFNEDKRCLLCYQMRLTATVKKAMAEKADAFTTTLLYSRYQNHELIINTAEKLAAEYGVPFYYEDFREGWQQGIDMAIEMDLYRQPYCGCIYSEQERYDKKYKLSSNTTPHK